MVVEVQYVGARAYTELRTPFGALGFGRGMVREVSEPIGAIVRELVDNGSTMWKIIDGSSDKTEAMKATIEPTVEEIVEESVVDDSTEEVDYTSMKRANLMALCKEQGIATKNTYTKAKLIELLTA